MNKGARWKLRAWDGAWLAGPGVEGREVERRTAALLVYLACEGATTRSRLAGLLYPGVPEATARNNLVQLLRRLRRVTGEDLVTGDTRLDLTPLLTVELGRTEEPGGTVPVLLGAVDYDDLPEFEEWLLARRERLEGVHRAHLAGLIDRLEEGGQYVEAAARTRALLGADPLSEETWRRLMRLHYLAGEREEALAAFEDCCRVLRDELRADPLPETRRLADEVRRGGESPRPRSAPLPTPAPPPRVALRPPVLVGREREWAQMEDAWARGHVIFISGPPGIGKTRLALDFAASKGACARQEARPGDAALPYGAAARNLRRILAAYPDAAPEGWVRRELSRILPELLGDEVPPAPLRGEEDRLRFFRAAASVLGHEARHVACTVDDDSQYYDRASFELGTFIFAQAARAGEDQGRPRLISTFRSGEAPPFFLEALHQLGGHSGALHLELQPLPPAGVRALVAALDLPGGEGHLGVLGDVAGGNPFLVLETLRHLTGVEGGGPVPPGTRELISARLARLSPAALLTARAAGVLQSDFDPEIVAELLSAPLMTVAAAWEELEAAQIMQGHRFAHDLVYETVRAGLPGAVRGMLHRSAARVLEGRGAPPARVARHWLDGDDPRRAVPWLLRAAGQAADALRVREALEWYAEAERVCAYLGDSAGAAEAARGRAALDALGVGT